MLKGLRTVGYHVNDLEGAKRWYAELLGKQPYFDQPFYVGFDVGGYELGLQPAAEGTQPGAGGDTAYWGVDDVQAALERIVERGGKLHQAAQDVGEGIVVGAALDPFGNVLGVIKNLNFAPPLTYAAQTDVSTRAIVKEAKLAATADHVFSLWSSSSAMATWWATESRIDLRPGGFYELYFLMDAPLGLRGGEGCRVLSYLPGRMLTFSWNAPPHLARTRALPTWVVLEFQPEASDCRFRLTHLGWPNSEWDEPESQWPETYAYFDAAWGRVLERLASHLSPAAPT